ncbi:MAG: arginine--tRNA ligase [Candidatus Margulisiibacteriota bacterium]
MLIRQVLADQIKTTLAQANIVLPVPIVMDVPAHSDHGDFATNVAFQLAKTLRKAPKQIAEDFAGILNAEWESQGLRFEALNGFLNLKLSDAWIWKAADQVTLTFPKTTATTLLEYVSANPTGPLHIGHGRWAVLGSALAQLLRFVGQPVSTEFYINDAGNQIQKFYESVAAVREGKPVPEGGYQGAYIHDLAASDADPLQANLEAHRRTLASVGVAFDRWFSEKTLYQNQAIDGVLRLLAQKDLSYTQDGALWFKSTAFGDEKDRVLVKADGAYTYFLVDIAYHRDKLSRGYDRLINIWGADHHGYVARVKAAVEAVSEAEKPQELVVLIGQLVSLVRGGEPFRMSKRTGEMVTFDEVIEEVGSDAIRYFLIQKSPDTHMDFDVELAAKKTNENPVFTIQYAHARLCGILKKLAEVSATLPKAEAPTTLEKAERALLLNWIQLPNDLWDFAHQMAPHRVAQAALETAKLFHAFYETCPLLKAPPEQQAPRLVILEKTQTMLAQLLHILGITAPQEM